MLAMVVVVVLVMTVTLVLLVLALSVRRIMLPYMTLRHSISYKTTQHLTLLNFRIK